ncbi:MAG: alpha/beta hydrolase [Oleiphilaceae bacterium]|nr:alpha/beta hydrolase [Oleiphilaceae bacterium]
MYWTQQASELSLPDWQREDAMAQLPAMDFRTPPPMGETARDYCRFYGLDLAESRPAVRHHMGTLNVDGYCLATHYYRHQYSRGTAFVLHGFFDHAGLYGRLMGHCLDEGLDVLVFDLPGHGLSSGERASISSFSQYRRVLAGVMESCRPHLKGPWVAVGQSTGGALLIDYLLLSGHDRDSAEFSAVVLLAPLIRPVGFTSGGVLHSLLKPFVRHWKRAFVVNSNDSVFVRFQQHYDPLQSRRFAVKWVTALREWVSQVESAVPVDYDLTVIQGEQDNTVAWRHNLRVLKHKFARLWVFQLPQARHHLVNESETLLAEVLHAVSESFNRVLPPRVKAPGKHNRNE